MQKNKIRGGHKKGYWIEYKKIKVVYRKKEAVVVKATRGSTEAAQITKSITYKEKIKGILCLWN